MQVDYIRRDTPEEICEEGGSYIQIVNKSTIGLKQSIKDAISSLFCVGDESLIESYFVGIMRSIYAGIAADGHSRTVGDITFYPVCTGLFDLDTGWNPLVNKVKVRARLTNGLTLDISDWSFRDVTTGRVSFSVDNIGNGTTIGVVSNDANTEINGRNFPASNLLTISWACNGKVGTVDASKITGNVSRLTIDKSAFSTLGSADTGKEITFVIKGCYNKVTKTAVYNYVQPTGTIQLLKIKEGSREDNIVFFTSSVVNITTANLTGGFQEGDELLFRATVEGTEDETYCTDCVSASSENYIELNNGFTNLSQHQSSCWNGVSAKCILKRDGVEYSCDCTFQQAS